jgi:hypothetical protein
MKTTMADNAVSETCPAHVSFSGHETFVFRYGWLKKAVDATIQNPEIFTTDESLAVLGVGKNMVRSIRHWSLATGVLQEMSKTRGARLEPTEFGLYLFGESGKDPYLEDPNSLWLLHWRLATNERRCTSWSWAFNLLQSVEFTRESLAIVFRQELAKHSLVAPSDGSLKRDLDCFVRTYSAPRGQKGVVAEDSLDCPLTELELITENPASGALQFRKGFQRTLSMEAFLYALNEYWGKVAPARDTLAFSEIAYSPGSPGSVFKLDENSLMERLEQLELCSEGALSFADTAGLKQVYRRAQPQALQALTRHYEFSDPRVAAGV